MFPVSRLRVQEVTLGGGVVVTAEMSVLDLQTQQVQDTVVHRCTFPAEELLGVFILFIYSFTIINMSM